MEGEIPKKLVRLRKPNFSPLEENVLQTLVEKNFNLLREKHTNTNTNVEKAKVWTEITEKINALGVTNRTQKEVRDKWRNLTSKAKSAFTLHRQEMRKTGGGPAPKMPSASVERVVNLLQDTSSFSGIEGGVETSSFSNVESENISASKQDSLIDDEDDVDDTQLQQDDCQIDRPRVPLSPVVVVSDRSNKDINNSIKRNISEVCKEKERKEKKKITQEDVFGMQISVLKEQRALFADQRHLVKVQIERESKHTEKLEKQIQLLSKISEERLSATTPLSSSQYALMSALCYEN